MKQDMNSVKDVKLNEIKEYVLSFDVSYKEEIQCCWSIKSLLKIVSFQKNIYYQALGKLYSCRTYEDMEYHLIMMNILFENYEYNEVKQDLLKKLLERRISLEIYFVIRHLIDFKDISFEYFIERLVKLNTPLMTVVKICLVEDEYELAYQYLKNMDYCHEQAVLDLICQYSPTLYCQLELHYYSKKKQRILFQRMS